LIEFQKIPDYNRYLVYIFIQLQNYLDVRMLVGLLLKNNIKDMQANLSPSELQFIKEEVVKGLADASGDIRRTAGVMLNEEFDRSYLSFLFFFFFFFFTFLSSFF
jgi:predicted translin family RNA/ssDNA-binding protein